MRNNAVNAKQPAAGNTTTQKGTAAANPLQPLQKPDFNPLQGVAQRALIKKNDLLIEQIKWQIMKGIYNDLTVTKKLQDQINFANALHVAGLIDKTAIQQLFKSPPKKNQNDFFSAQKNKGLGKITFESLMKHNLLVEGSDILATASATWEEFKTDINDDNEATGQGGNIAHNNKAVSTKIQWQDEDGSAKEGKGVNALILAADHPMGSAPSGDGKIKSEQLTELTGQPYIAGHLLNDHLGGPGSDVRNIAAIPKDVNTEQSDKVEEEVKKRVNENHEIMYYRVDVTYKPDPNKKDKKKKNVHYASLLKSQYGTYKEDTDFSKLAFGQDPTTHLINKKEHHLPILSPAEYENEETGYLATKSTLHYDTNNKPRTPEEVKNIPGNAAKLSVDKQRDLILKDAKQVKLEYISFAIYALPIKQLEEKIKAQEKEIGDQQNLIDKKDLLIGEGYKEIVTLEEKLEKYRKAIEEIQAEYEIDKDQTGEADEALDDLLKQVKEERQQREGELEKVKEELQQVKDELEQTKEKLGERTNLSREQFRYIGYSLGLHDEVNAYSGPVPSSPYSQGEFDQGVKEGSHLRVQDLEEEEGGKQELQQQNRQLSQQNYELGRSNEQLTQENRSLIDENQYLQGRIAAKESKNQVYQIGYTHGNNNQLPLANFNQLLPQLIPHNASYNYQQGFISEDPGPLIESYNNGYYEGQLQFISRSGYNTGKHAATNNIAYNDHTFHTDRRKITAYKNGYRNGYQSGNVQQQPQNPLVNPLKRPKHNEF